MIERFTSNIITGQLFFIVFIVQSFTQVKNYIMLLAPISSNLSKRLRLDIAFLKTSGIGVLSVIQC